MPKIPRIPSRLVIRTLQKDGFYTHHQTGSHVHLRHNTRSQLRIVVPVTRKDMKPKTLQSIIRQAGLTVEEFIGLL